MFDRYIHLYSAQIQKKFGTVRKAGVKIGSRNLCPGLLAPIKLIPNFAL